MIGQRPGWGRVLQRRGGQGVRHRVADLGGVELGSRQPEIEAEMQFVGPQILRPAGVVVYPHLADGYRSGVLVDHRADVAVNRVHIRVVEARVVIAVVQHLDAQVR
ncbi:Uncharacterised protein [Mycobacterium tuberculosis]|uniref:Uncharacterized protein n=1 Tax=Mycobacterium tuberculosis TaxID=1773 RepID=A0A0U0UFS9_MYCTX|nr:Uncharacterised protein [Mycobacterium tuberculosis]COY76050.1 Uncharacterised protein [Mycobacterium tuberculosis]COZ50143.1 Uncharacterised protein [Mycobacterium tuberculosis]